MDPHMLGVGPPYGGVWGLNISKVLRDRSCCELTERLGSIRKVGSDTVVVQWYIWDVNLSWLDKDPGC